MTIYFYGNDIDKWEKICKDAEEGKVPKITLRGIEYALVRHGKWIKSEKSDFNWECSECGYGLTDNKLTYCYDCGAKMEVNDEL